MFSFSFSFLFGIFVLTLSFAFGRFAKFITKKDFGLFNNTMIGFLGAITGELVDFNIFRGWGIALIFGMMCTIVLFFIIDFLNYKPKEK